MNEHAKDIFWRMLGKKELSSKLIHLYERVKFLNDRVAPGPILASTLALIAVLSESNDVEEIRLDGNKENLKKIPEGDVTLNSEPATQNSQ